MEQEKTRVSILNSGLKRKTLLLTGVLMLAVVMVQLILSSTFLNISNNDSISHVRHNFDTNIKTAVDTIISALEQNYEMYLNGVISEETAKEIAEKIVRDSRYSSGAGYVDDGYFWADMADGYCAVHYNPANEGVMRWDFVDQEGTYYIREFIAQGDSGGGYSDFYFGKPGDEGGSHRKRGFTKKFEPYGWYVSTGNYYEDTDAVIADMETVRRTDFFALFITSLATIAVGLILMSVNLNRVVTPIIKISDKVKKLSMGDTDIETFDTAVPKDEIGELQQSLITVVHILHKLLEDINSMISEHEKGNIDFSFKTDEFFGDYKRLADSVLELASFSMRDQLTGIPNRRSFDNRLDLEWERAKREKLPISLLMIDIDRFKRYNDTFGHQQGDVTLKVVADTIRQSLKRTIDFAARWGGEEFVVLLSNTGAAGAFSVAENIRRAVEELEIPCEEALGRKATISIGAAAFEPLAESEIAELVQAADSSLYEAKETGRNKVCLFDLNKPAGQEEKTGADQ